MRSLKVVALFFWLGAPLLGQDGAAEYRWREEARRVGRIMARGDYAARMAEVERLLRDPAPPGVWIIVRGVAVSWRRTERLERRVQAHLERVAELVKRLKLRPPQTPRHRTGNREVDGLLDRVAELRDRLAAERKFRAETQRVLRRQLRALPPERQAACAAYLLADLKRVRGPERVALVQVVGQLPVPEAVAAALEVARSDRDPLVRLTAIDALGRSGRAEAAAGLLTLLQDPRWQIRSAVVAALRRLRRPEAVPALIEALAREKGRLEEDVLAALQDLTGVRKGANAAVWRRWWREHAGEPLPPRQRVRLRRRQEDWGTTAFYGITTRSRHIVYILDHSGSMRQPAGRTSGESKLDVAKRELLQSLAALPPDATFNILFYADTYSLFRKRMVKATRQNKQAARAYVLGVTAQGSTNVYDTLERAFQIGGQGAVDKAYRVSFDTIFFLTDGSPTSGKTTDTEEILAAVARWNKLKRIKVHCVGVGRHNARFLQRLARMTGGRYVRS